jgi:hypothetical protein
MLVAKRPIYFDRSQVQVTEAANIAATKNAEAGRIGIEAGGSVQHEGLRQRGSERTAKQGRVPDICQLEAVHPKGFVHARGDAFPKRSGANIAGVGEQIIPQVATGGPENPDCEVVPGPWLVEAAATLGRIRGLP